MTIQIRNTSSRKTEDFLPIQDGQVRMYHCGPTVYSSPHIGNFRSFLMADLLGRHLRARGYEVTQVMNITDVGHLTEDDIEQGEDKMLVAARREKLDPYEVARKYEAEFVASAQTLGFDLDNYEMPRATDHIPEMLEIIEGLLEAGHAYRVGDGDVYFSIESFERFGKLSGKVLDDLESGARVAVIDEKKDPRDFALWKTDAKHLMQWDAPWGRGFPGWHIECSAMSRKYLGDQFDVHTGGEDNLFPHHECEVAQSECFTHKQPFVRYWMHCRHLLVNGEKMAKSKGNFFTIQDLLDKGFKGEEIRLALINVHYRKPMNFTLDGIDEVRAWLARVRDCRARLVRIREGLETAGNDEIATALADIRNQFGSALDSDLNIAGALAAVSELVTILNKQSPSVEAARAALILFEEFDHTLACLGGEPEVEKSESGVLWGGDPADPRRNDLLAQASARETARVSKNWSEADRLRDEIQAAGFRLVDTPEGPRLDPIA